MRFHLDEHINFSVAKSLRRRGIDVTTTADASLQGAPDSVHVEFARQSGRIIVTYDEDFLALANAGMKHAGIVYCHPGTRSLGQIIDYLLLIDACLSEEDMSDHVEFC